MQWTLAEDLGVEEFGRRDFAPNVGGKNVLLGYEPRHSHNRERERERERERRRVVGSGDVIYIHFGVWCQQRVLGSFCMWYWGKGKVATYLVDDEHGIEDKGNWAREVLLALGLLLIIGFLPVWGR